jgi:hypothetical protein
VGRNVLNNMQVRADADAGAVPPLAHVFGAKNADGTLSTGGNAQGSETRPESRLKVLSHTFSSQVTAVSVILEACLLRSLLPTCKRMLLLSWRQF